MRQLKVAVDLDGCLAAHIEWQGPEHIGEPLPGALEAMQALVAAGHQVLVLTSRCSSDDRETWAPGYTIRESSVLIRAWLDRYGFPEEMEIWTGHGKPFADVYFDDRAVNVAPQKQELAWPWAMEVVARVEGGDPGVALF